MSNKYFVSRQAYYYQGGALAVEVASGGVNYSGCDMLVEKYAGEGKEYIDPREAVKAAISIALQWKEDKPDEEISLVFGGGFDMFEGEAEGDLSDEVFESAKKWAEEEWESLPKCAYCNEPLDERESYTLKYSYPEYEEELFCSENCADTFAEKNVEYECEICHDMGFLKDMVAVEEGEELETSTLVHRKECWDKWDEMQSESEEDEED